VLSNVSLVQKREKQKRTAMTVNNEALALFGKKGTTTRCKCFIVILCAKLFRCRFPLELCIVAHRVFKSRYWQVLYFLAAVFIIQTKVT